MLIETQFKKTNKVTLLKGDALKKLDELPDASVSLVVTSPPYNIGKVYERDTRLSLTEYVDWLESIIDKIAKKLKPDGSICWQVGNYIEDGEVFPLDILFYDLFKKKGFKLRNRIIWHFNFGLHSSKRFSGRYETLLWFTKADEYKFNLDPVRIPQLYPGKRHARNKDNAGKPSGNPLGKNPTDYWVFNAESTLKDGYIWEIPNVKANHPEKTIHPCQFPVELVERCVLALTNKNDLVLDPFVGTGTSLIAARKHGRKAVGIDKMSDYLKIARDRLNKFDKGELNLRQIGKEVHKPNQKDKVARVPLEWKELDRKTKNGKNSHPKKKKA